jgi:hypothetical protein
MKRASIISLVMLLLAPQAAPYLSNYTNGQRDRWTTLPVAWRVNTRTNSNIQGTRPITDVITASFNTWMAAPNTAVRAVDGGTTDDESPGMDGINLVCFVCTGDFSQEAETLAVTITTVSVTNAGGQIIDADILFNPNRNFSKDGASGVEDVQTIATHEIGHFFGLDHTGIARAMMFPFSPDNERRLAYDDAAAIATQYPAAMQAVPTFTISGTVRLNSAAVFGAHVFADSQTPADTFPGFNLRKSPISAVSLTDGAYRIEGVPSDSYIITAEPFDLPVVNDNLTGFASSFSRAAVQTGFTTRWH